MSLTFPNLVLPTCVGWNFDMSSKYSTIRQDPPSALGPASASLQRGVIYELQLTYEFLKNAGLTYTNDLAYVQEFYEAVRGGYGFFTFDPGVFPLRSMFLTQNTTQLSNGFFGIGDGVTKTFQLWRSTSALGAGTVTFCEMIQNVTLLAGIYQGGVLVASGNYTLSNFPSQVTFTTAPPSGAVLSWSGNYSYLCRFSDDTLDVSEFAYQFWELKSLKLQTVNLRASGQ